MSKAEYVVRNGAAVIERGFNERLRAEQRARHLTETRRVRHVVCAVGVAGEQIVDLVEFCPTPQWVFEQGLFDFAQG